MTPSPESFCEVSTPTRGGDTFGVNSSNDRRFGSLGLNLIFNGLLLGVSQRRHMKGWQQPSPRVGPGSAENIHEAFICWQIYFSIVTGTWSHFQAMRQRTAGRGLEASSKQPSEASVEVSTKARRWRARAGDQARADTWSSTRGVT
jgi:hypothetical protein